MQQRFHARWSHEIRQGQNHKSNLLYQQILSQTQKHSGSYCKYTENICLFPLCCTQIRHCNHKSWEEWPHSPLCSERWIVPLLQLFFILTGYNWICLSRALRFFTFALRSQPRCSPQIVSLAKMTLVSPSAPQSALLIGSPLPFM